MLMRIARCTINGITTLLVLLCAASICLWSRSYSRCEFFWTTRLPTTLYFFHEAGRFRLGVWQNNSPDLKAEVKTGYFRVPCNDPHGRDFFISASDLGMPYWCSTLALASLPGLRLTRYLRRLELRHRRESIGLCPVCGYNLLASPERCPECGTEKRRY